jgi:hypothetical protein
MTRDKGRTYIQMPRVEIEHARSPFFFEAAREAGVHARSAGDHDMLVQLRADADRHALDRLEEHLCDARLLDVD